MGATCGGCDAALGPRNQSGYCRQCYSRHGLPADHGERISRARKLRFQIDPAALKACQDHARRVGKLPASVEARRRSAVERRIWEIGQPAAITPEARRKAAASTRATRLAWCPPELREEYVRLIKTCRIKAVDARRMVLEQHEANMRRWREQARPETWRNDEKAAGL